MDRTPGSLRYMPEFVTLQTSDEFPEDVDITLDYRGLDGSFDHCDEAAEAKQKEFRSTTIGLCTKYQALSFAPPYSLALHLVFTHMPLSILDASETKFLKD